jgi:hypothetical protein
MVEKAPQVRAWGSSASAANATREVLLLPKIPNYRLCTTDFYL